MGNPEKILEYLSRYVFRIAIADRRILEVKDGKVLFSWKDYRSGRFRQMKLDIDEFIRRFLLHVLPKGFFKVRYYGIFSSRYRKQNILMCKTMLEQDKRIRPSNDIFSDMILATTFAGKTNATEKIFKSEHASASCPATAE